MRNLRSLRHTHIKFAETDLPLAATAWDADTDGLICAFGPTETEAVIELKRFDKDSFQPEDGRLIASWDALCPLPDLPCDKILSARYFAETQSTCLILAGGDLVVVRENAQPGEDLIEIVGSVDAGITAAAWSPDDELVAISTRANTFILMTRTFESTANVQMTPDDVKVSAHVSVGWGKKETQFHGKRAKALRDPTVPEHVDEGVLSDHDGGETTITWRGDGAYAAISTVEEGKRRMIRVYSRDGILDSVSEPVDGLEGALSWRPSGNLIAGIQSQLSGDVRVVFFERNGLRHGEFPLRICDSTSARPDWSTRTSLAWSTDSSVLAVSFKDRIQLWTMGNYHYYLKQEVSLSLQANAASNNWHPEKPLSLAASSSEDLCILNYALQVSGGSTNPPDDLGSLAVVDGSSLKITPMRLANVPPPMSFIDKALPAKAIDVCFNGDTTRAAVLDSTHIRVYRMDLLGEGPTEMSLLKSIDIAALSGTKNRTRQIALDASNNIAVLFSMTNQAKDHIMVFAEDGTPRGRIASVDGTVVTLTARSDRDRMCYQISRPGGTATSVVSFDASKADGDVEELTSLPSVCSRVEVWQADDVSMVFGLTSGGTLYIQGRSIGESHYSQRLHQKGVTSFLTTPSHLILTTSQNLVKFVHLHEGELEMPLDEPEKDERCRSIERGARLVTVMPSAYALVLQMPRGNLETIYPRALVLAGIRKAINANDYRKAFFACRNHRVDMNILHDFAPAKFMTSIDRFVDQLRKPAHIDLFLSQLRDEDVTETLYKDTLNAPKQSIHTPANNGMAATTPVTSKTNRICDAFITTLSRRQSTHVQNLITSHVCKQPPDLESGLRLISSLGNPTSPSPALDRAIEHITFLTDAHRLYDTALGLYDLDTALLVAQHAQKDPREYLPYLQSLQTLPALRRNATIDHDLKRYAKSLTSLIAMGDDAWEEAKRYATRYELYGQLIEGVKYQKGKSREGTRLWAEFLEERNRYKEAGIAWEGLGEYGAAEGMYRAAGLWRECLACAQLGGKGNEEVRALARGIAEGLEEGKDWSPAAVVWGDYLGEWEEVVRCWCRAYRFDEAIRRVGMSGRKELLGVVDRGLGEGFATMSEVLAEMKGQVAAQRGRLSELREKKKLDPLGFYDGTPASGNPDIPDDVSLAPSMTSTSAGTFMTRYTNRTSSTIATNTTRKTSKNRRREERKKARGKKGSVYEEEYLVSSIGRLVERLNSIGEEVQRLIEGLMRRDMRERAVAIHTLMREVIEATRLALPEVYEQNKEEKQDTRVDGEEDMDITVAKRELPMVKTFEGLSLLG
ncbi:Elongator complex protein 1 [Sphaceloma murrayae]|uniref:Elongator complex protein 1 n=1 Tax=Sphaceloma murrayae TaxID=2082308 RepID=A0A2K1QFQ9_9PEZI|nr:Elongator complex protein 1 [Sphaceloma murrayae]